MDEYVKTSMERIAHWEDQGMPKETAIKVELETMYQVGKNNTIKVLKAMLSQIPDGAYVPTNPYSDPLVNILQSLFKVLKDV
jgi:hypothetical protein